MIKPGLLLWVFSDETTYYARILRIFGLGLEKVDTNSMKGYVLLFGIFSFEIGIHLTKRRGDYVKRVENEESPTASA